MELIHTCYRITDPEKSVAFYEALGLEKWGRSRLCFVRDPDRKLTIVN